MSSSGDYEKYGTFELDPLACFFQCRSYHVPIGFLGSFLCYFRIGSWENPISVPSIPPTQFTLMERLVPKGFELTLRGTRPISVNLTLGQWTLDRSYIIPSYSNVAIPNLRNRLGLHSRGILKKLMARHFSTDYGIAWILGCFAQNHFVCEVTIILSVNEFHKF